MGRHSRKETMPRKKCTGKNELVNTAFSYLAVILGPTEYTYYTCPYKYVLFYMNNLNLQSFYVFSVCNVPKPSHRRLVPFHPEAAVCHSGLFQQHSL